MTDVNWERYARATGAVFVVCFVVGLIIAGMAPSLGDSTDKLVSYYDGDRGRILTAAFIIGIGLVALLWFVGAIANALREAGQGRLAATTIGAGTTLVGFVMLVVTLNAALAFKIAAEGNAAVIRAFFDLQWVVGVMISFPAAALVAAAAVGLQRAGLIPDWLGRAGIAVALLDILGGTTWATSGFWAADGAYSQMITPALSLAWTLVTSVLLYMRAPVTAAGPERAATPSMT